MRNATRDHRQTKLSRAGSIRLIPASPPAGSVSAQINASSHEGRVAPSMSRRTNALPEFWIRPGSYCFKPAALLFCGVLYIVKAISTQAFFHSCDEKAIPTNYRRRAGCANVWQAEVRAASSRTSFRLCVAQTATGLPVLLWIPQVLMSTNNVAPTVARVSATYKARRHSGSPMLEPLPPRTNACAHCRPFARATLSASNRPEVMI